MQAHLSVSLLAYMINLFSLYIGRLYNLAYLPKFVKILKAFCLTTSYATAFVLLFILYFIFLQEKVKKCLYSEKDTFHSHYII